MKSFLITSSIYSLLSGGSDIVSLIFSLILSELFLGDLGFVSISESLLILLKLELFNDKLDVILGADGFTSL